jgi:hypothetical protein
MWICNAFLQKDGDRLPVNIKETLKIMDYIILSEMIWT